MTKDSASMTGNIALLSKVFDFLNQLDEKQIADFLEGKVELHLGSQADSNIEA